MADYLVSEVLAGLPWDRREFMLRTCLVDTVSPELADALTGHEGATLTLAAIERLGAPVAATDAEGHWYRYHPLFGELLRAHLRHAHPEEIPFLHRRAARWYAEQGETMPAIRHALAGEDWEQAGDLIAENWLELFLRGRSAAMRGPMAQLPADVVAADPRLAAAFAGSRLQDGDLQDAERHLTIARAARSETAGPAREALDLVLTTVALYHARLRVNVKDAERLRPQAHRRGAGLLAPLLGVAAQLRALQPRGRAACGPATPWPPRRTCRRRSRSPARSATSRSRWTASRSSRSCTC